mgnify:FL=1
MKKIFFFLFLFLSFPFLVLADSIKELEVVNGTISREFESTNNIYSVILEDSEDTLKLNYELKDPEAKVVFHNNEYTKTGENKVEMEIQNTDGTKETYTFYLEKEETTPVFNENILNYSAKKQEEIPFLPWYVGAGCLLLILLFFKIIVLGFKKKGAKK